jgi:hypothetical protein
MPCHLIIRERWSDFNRYSHYNESKTKGNDSVNVLELSRTECIS